MKTEMRATLCALTGVLVAGSCGGGLEGELLDALRVEEHETFLVGPQLFGVDAFHTDDGKLYVARTGDYSLMGSSSSIDALERLKAKGYATTEATSLPRNFANYFDAFEVTKKGAEYFRPNAFGLVEVCVGERWADEVLDYTEPAGGGPQVIEARIRYEISFNRLVDDLDVEDELAREVSQRWPGEGTAIYVKTNKGWRLEGASWQ